MSSLKEKTAKGLFWGMLSNGSTQLLNLIIGIFLGRLLSPTDYGIVGVLTIFTAIAGNLQAAGFTQALINIHRPKANDYNSVFWFNVIASVCIYAVLFACAPLIARFFHQECLVGVSRLVFLSFVIASLGIAHNAWLVKNLMIRETAIIGFVALVCSGTAGITLALLGYGYWSLAWQQIIYISVTNIVRLRYSRWRPSLHIDFEPVRRMFPFAVKLLFTNILNTVSQHVLTFIFGRLLPIRDVGNYSQASKWNTMAHSFVSGTVAQVAQPVLAEVADDGEREQRVFRKMLRFTAFMSFPVMFGLALVADEFIFITIGEQWKDAVPLLRILCIGGAFMPFYTLFQNLVISQGRSDLYLWTNIVQIALQIAVVLALASHGIIIMVTAYTLLTIAYLLVWQLLAHHLIRVSVLQMFADTLPFCLIALAVMIATYFMSSFTSSPYILFPIRVIIAVLLYFAVMKLLRVKLLDEFVQFKNNIYLCRTKNKRHQ
ncbi:MAG: lipopolysaccharide biosynthesis protein [Prevotella sp.]|nr:lipopolysaccharide biosynthesis protein [Prevotella sp.]